MRLLRLPVFQTGQRQIGQSGSLIEYQQVANRTPVFAAVLKIHFDADGNLYAANGVFIPKVPAEAAPKLSASEAEAIAITTASGADRLLASTSLQAVNNTIYWYQDGLLEGTSGPILLVYEVEVSNPDISTREFIYVDAQTGKIINRIDGIHTDLDREVSETSLANVVWDESNGDPLPIPPGWAGGNAQQVTDWNNEADGAGETYHIFRSMAAYDSYDDAGATMRTVNNDPGISCPNANWNGTSTNYCSDVTGDDTVAHEWGHAYTEYTNNLIYQWQSGALNESYSDIWGEVVDLLNGRGTDTPDVLRTGDVCSSNPAGNNLPGYPEVDTVRWLSGEDDPAFGGAIRDLWTPECYGDPGTVTSSSYFCSAADSGGVHTNSGVPNRAFALMVDGDAGLGITGIGLTKAAHIHWAAQNMLTPSSNFVDQADALEAACTALTGVNLNSLSTTVDTQTPSGEIITVADCAEVSDIIAEVEFRTFPDQCGFLPVLDPAAPALCQDQGDGTVNSIASEDWESGSLPAGWSVGTRDVVNQSTFDTPDWAVVAGLPAGANGTYAAFVEDGLYGDCAADTEAGVLYLESPIFNIPVDVLVPRVAVDHWVATEAGWDGGNIKYSLNGGAWTLLPTSAYDFNAYNSSLNSPSDNPMGGEAAFTGSNGGTGGGSWGQSQVNLYGIATAGDDVQFRFDMGLDGCNGDTGWYVDDVQVYSCNSEEPPPPNDDFTCNSTIGFEDGAFPVGWTTTSNALASGQWVVSTDNSSSFWNPGAAPEGSYYASANDDLPGSGSDGSADYLYTNILDLSGYGRAELTFQYHFNATFGHAAGGVQVSPDGGATWDAEIVVPAGGSWQSYTLDLSDYVGNDNVQIRFHSDDGGFWAAGYAIDDVGLACVIGPRIDVDPDSIETRQPTDMQTQQTFDIHNVGDEQLDWTIEEVNSTAHAPTYAADVVTDQVERVGTADRAPADVIASILNAPEVDVVTDGGFEAGPFGGTWAEASSNFGTPVCDLAGCGTGTGTGPHSGTYWTWFGGIGTYEEGSMTQDVTIPSGIATLTFWLEQILCDSPADYMEVTIDGTQIFLTDGSSSLCGVLGYAQQSVDVSAYADDGTHTLEFHSEIFANNGGGSNFFVDDVVLDVQAPICDSSDIPWASLDVSSGSTAPAAMDTVTVTFDSTGLADGEYTGTLCIETNDPLNPSVNVPLTMTVRPNELFLPIITKGYGNPDLVVNSIEAENGDISVVIQNVGTGPVNSAFWVDLYIDPNPVPTAVNQTWDTNSTFGAAWGVSGAALPLMPGDSLTLTLNDAYFNSANSNLPATLHPASVLYAQVDSLNAGTTYGNVLEGHEINGGSYNNITGPVPATSMSLQVPTNQSAQTGQQANHGLPSRR